MPARPHRRARRTHGARHARHAGRARGARGALSTRATPSTAALRRAAARRQASPERAYRAAVSELDHAPVAVREEPRV